LYLIVGKIVMFAKGGGFLMIIMVLGVMNGLGVVMFTVKDMVVEFMMYIVIDMIDLVMVM